MLNPNIESSKEGWIKYVETGFSEAIKRNKLEIGETDAGLTVFFKSKLMETVPFSWTFSLKEENSSVYSFQLLHPLFVMLKELQRRNNELQSLVVKKDREIQDYKDHGATISRRHLETIPFDKNVFNIQNNQNEEFVGWCSSEIDVGSLSKEGLRDMYQNVMINKQCGVRQDDLPSTVDNQQRGTLPTFDTAETNEDVAPVVNLPSWEAEGHLPGSVVQDNADKNEENVIQRPDLMTEQDLEQQRREALRRRLEEETEKKQKKKKRKLKI